MNPSSKMRKINRKNSTGASEVKYEYTSEAL